MNLKSEKISHSDGAEVESLSCELSSVSGGKNVIVGVVQCITLLSLLSKILMKVCPVLST